MSALTVPSFPDYISLLMFYFLKEVDEYGTFIEIGDMVDGVIPHDEYVDEMLAMGMSQIDGIIQLKLASPFDLFRVSAIEVAEEIQTALDLEFSMDAIVVDDLFEDTIASIEGVSDFVDPPLSFYVLSRFVSYSNDVHDLHLWI